MLFMVVVVAAVDDNVMMQSNNGRCGSDSSISSDISICGRG